MLSPYVWRAELANSYIIVLPEKEMAVAETTGIQFTVLIVR
jgi:hypothetical protein